jgi:excinuclease ABC subunit A
VEAPCDVCSGRRFNQETLAVRYKGYNIAQVLAMNVDQAVEFFSAVSNIRRPLALLQDVGLGYLTLGQRSPTLSGGEAQRIKLVTELAKSKSRAENPKAAKHTLYILDEPTIGLHMADEEKLIRVLHRLVDAGNTVLLIEHSLDLIAEADWLIDLGPEGGDAGGRLMAEGAPEAVAQTTASHTAKFLKPFLADRRQPAAD